MSLLIHYSGVRTALFHISTSAALEGMRSGSFHQGYRHRLARVWRPPRRLHYVAHHCVYVRIGVRGCGMHKDIWTFDKSLRFFLISLVKINIRFVDLPSTQHSKQDH